MTTARITSKGQITIPKRVRDQLGVAPGDSLEFHFDGDRLEVRPVKRRQLREFRGRFRVNQALDFAEERERAWSARARQLTDGDGVDGA